MELCAAGEGFYRQDSTPPSTTADKMLSPQEYRKLAAQCVDLAEKLEAKDREILLYMAEIWLRLASKANQSANKLRDR
jgi:hypothetical protein